MGALRLKLGLWYALFLGAIGAFNPWFAVVLDDAGATGLVKAGILALFPVGVLVAGPLGTLLADRSRRPMAVLKGALVVSALAAAGLLGSWGLAGLAALTAVLAFARAPVTSILDMFAVGELGWSRGGYGSVRSWGSIGFVVASLAVGYSIDAGWLRTPLVLGAAGMVALAFLTLTFPERPPAAGGDRRVSLKRVLSLPVIFWLCIVGTLHRGTICYYDAFYTLHVTRGLDLPAAIGGISVALGVGIEVGVLLLGHRLLERFGATTLVLISVASGLPRWLLTSSLTDPTLLVATQALHGVGFGCWWVGGLALIDRHAPGELRNTAQGLFMAAGHGLGALLAMGLAAVLLDRTDSGTIFLWVAALSGLALVFAVFALRPAVARSAGRARTA